MGGSINTNTTHGSSNFDGSIQCTISHNSAAGFSIVRYNGTGSGGATIGHELGAKPHFIMWKNLDANVDWRVYHHKISGTDGTRSYRLNSLTNIIDSFFTKEGLNLLYKENYYDYKNNIFYKDLVYKGHRYYLINRP